MSSNRWPWMDEVETMAESQPQWSDECAPMCSGSCPQHDGKRCRALGLRPGAICEPAVELMAELLCHRSP
jgi:hypothetical protein